MVRINVAKIRDNIGKLSGLAKRVITRDNIRGFLDEAGKILRVSRLVQENYKDTNIGKKADKLLHPLGNIYGKARAIEGVYDRVKNNKVRGYFNPVSKESQARHIVNRIQPRRSS